MVGNPPGRSSSRSLGPGLLGLVSMVGAGACTKDDPCEGLRVFDPPPPPKPTTTSPPMVLDGGWIGAGVLELSFSEPLALGTPPDPARFAIIGWSALVQNYSGYGYYYYNYGNGNGNGSDSCYERTRYGLLGQGYYGRATVTDVWVAPEDATLLRLRLSNTGAACSTITSAVGQGVMLVYTNEPSLADAVLMDANGDPVPDLGPAWALSALESCLGPYSYYCYSLSNTATGHLPGVSSLAEIPCP